MNTGTASGRNFSELPNGQIMSRKNFTKSSEEIWRELRVLETQCPILKFTTNTFWRQARWKGTTYRWHSSSENPPVMGIIFENAEPGKELFRQLVESQTNSDRFEELRISIIEGSPPGQRFGYSIHICPDPDSLAAYATAADMVLDPNLIRFAGRWNRCYPIPGNEPLLPTFKEQFKKHGEFILAPVTRRDDGKEYFCSELGIIKHTIESRQLSDITPDDIDAAALELPTRISP